MTKKEFVPREVINGNLLAALDDRSKVAIVASEDDLDLLIDALEIAKRSFGAMRDAKACEMISDLTTLKASAFK